MQKQFMQMDLDPSPLLLEDRRVRDVTGGKVTGSSWLRKLEDSRDELISLLIRSKASGSASPSLTK